MFQMCIALIKAVIRDGIREKNGERSVYKEAGSIWGEVCEVLLRYRYLVGFLQTGLNRRLPSANLG